MLVCYPVEKMITGSSMRLCAKSESTTESRVDAKDINMRIKAKGAGFHVEDYRTDQLIDDIRFLTKGFEKVEGDFGLELKMFPV